VLPGGRIYVSRALISLLDKEDQPAGIMADELAHLVARHESIQVSRQLKAVLDVTEVGDRNDIDDKYLRMRERLWIKPNLLEHQVVEERDQREADRIGLLIQAAAGYNPAAQVEAFDRLAQTGGKGSNLFLNLMNCAPDRRRLGEMVKSMSAACESKTPAIANFAQWRQNIMQA
jgi:predicted Zn-dependent protease